MTGTVTEMPPRFKFIPPTPVDAGFWTAGEGQDLIQWSRRQLEGGRKPADLVLPLKARFGELGVEALELASGAERAAGISNLPQLRLIHRESLEQSSKPPINDLHAAYFRGCKAVLEVGTGLGLDTIALARVVPRVISLEPNVQRARYAQENLRWLGVSNVEVIAQTLEQSLDLAKNVDGVFADPSRRLGGERVRGPNECAPSLDTLLAAAADKLLVVKLSPTAGSFQPITGTRRCFVGSASEALEMLLVRDPGFAREASEQQDQMQIADGERGVQYLTLQTGELPRLSIEAASFIYETHPISLCAADGITTVCKRFDLSLLTTEHGYFGSKDLQETGLWAKRYEVIETVAFRQEKIQALVDKHLLSNNTAVKKREHKVNPDALHRAIRWHPAKTPEQSRGFALLCIDSGTNQWCSLARAV